MELTMSFSTLTSKGQLTLPVEIRRALRLKAGDQVEFYADLDGVIRLRARNLASAEMFEKFDAIFAERPAAPPDDDAILDIMKEEDDRVKAQTVKREAA
jgi:antitoxin PrlF